MPKIIFECPFNQCFTLTSEIEKRLCKANVAVFGASTTQGVAHLPLWLAKSDHLARIRKGKRWEPPIGIRCHPPLIARERLRPIDPLIGASVVSRHQFKPIRGIKI